MGEENMLIEAQKLSIQKAINSLDAKKNIKANAMRLFNQMGIDGIFGRTDIMEVVGISITASWEPNQQAKRCRFDSSRKWLRKR